MGLSADRSKPAARTALRVSFLVLVGGFAIAASVWFAGDRDVGETLAAIGAGPFFLAMTLLPAVGAPLSPFLILAGASFERGTALGGSWIALALNLALCYWLASRGARAWIERLLRRFNAPLPHFDRADARAVRFTLAIKAMPGLPAFLKNYGLGIAGVPFGLYFGLSLLISGSYATALVLFGESLSEHRVLRGGVVAATVVGILGVILARARAAKAGRPQ
jgi:uncharacterized membrane protein YdjX (TVP38/TMEM64 family)